MNLSYRPIETIKDALTLREIRNTGCRYLTGHDQEITIHEQLEWFSHYPWQETYRFWLFYDGEKVVGYGGLQKRTWKGQQYNSNTMVVLPDQQRKGYGREILSTVVRISHKEGTPVLALVRADNEASVVLHRDWDFLETVDGINYYLNPVMEL